MFFWYLNALRTLIAALFFMLSAGEPVDCSRVWDMPPGSHMRPGDTYEEWYGSLELMCAKKSGMHQEHWRYSIICYGTNC